MATETDVAAETVRPRDRPRGASSTPRLHALAGVADPQPARWRVVNPSGAHALAVGLDAPVEVEIEGHVGYYCAGMNKQATVRVHGNAGVGRRREHHVRDGRRRGQRQPVGRRDRPRRPARRRGRRVGALRHLDEGRRHRRARLGRAHERVHGPEGLPRRLRRRRRRARRLHLRGAPVRARVGRRASAPTASRRRCATSTSPSCAGCSSAPASTTPTRATSAATARRAASTTSTSTTPGEY